MIPALDDEPHPHSAEIMAAVDSLPPPMRQLVYEYGFKIVDAMIEDGYTDPFELADLLETWRERRQAEWLRTDYLKRRQ